MPRIGDPAPQFEAVTTHGTIQLEEFKGTWLVLFSHPADFTPVCTTEFIAFAEAHSVLRQMNTELLGLSIDSVYAHISWVRNIEEKLDVKITFPVIADLSQEVANLYGMIMPGESTTEASRCVFVIDDEQIVRAMIYYPLTTGRNVDEIVRLVTALQTTDEPSGHRTPDHRRERSRHPRQLAPGRPSHGATTKDPGRGRGARPGRERRVH
jgi:peroxiredoxin (alkyl hydroperoxide reductase subunit C)